MDERRMVFVDFRRLYRGFAQDFLLIKNGTVYRVQPMTGIAVRWRAGNGDIAYGSF
jgi:hypothetical protein